MKRLFTSLAGIFAACLVVLPSLHSAPRPAWPPWPEQTLALYRFDDLEWRAYHRPPPLGLDSAQLTPSWSEYALVRDGFSLSPVAIPTVDASGRPSFAPGSGAVRFWFCPHWTSKAEGGTGPGTHARLLELVSLDASKLQTRWSLYTDESGDGIWFSGLDPAGKAADYLAAKAEFVAGEWVLVTLCYSEQGSQLWLNAELVAEGKGVPAPAQWQEGLLGLLIGSDLVMSSPAYGQFEEVATFDYWPDAGQQQFYFNGVSRQVFKGTVGTAEEEALKVALLEELFPREAILEDEGGGVMMIRSYEEGELWLEMTGVSNGWAHLTLHGAEPDITYEIFSVEALGEPWMYETNVLGVMEGEPVAFEVAVGERTNALFLPARSEVDTDGDGLPDWWELEHGLDPLNRDTGDTGVSDGYKSPAEDGWTNLEKYQRGSDPNVFYTPPAPQGLRVRVGNASPPFSVSIHWQPSTGAGNGYVVSRWIHALSDY